MKFYSTPEEARDDFSALLDGELSQEDREALESYIADEAGLLRELDALKRVDAAYRDLPASAAPARFEDRIRARLRPPLIRLPRWKSTTGPRLIALAATVFAVATIGVISVVMRTALSGGYDGERVAQAPVAATTMQSLPAQAAPAPGGESSGGRVGEEGAAASQAFMLRPEVSADADNAPALRAAEVPAAPAASPAPAPATLPASEPPRESFQVAQANRLDDLAQPDESRSIASAKQKPQAAAVPEKAADTLALKKENEDLVSNAPSPGAGATVGSVAASNERDELQDKPADGKDVAETKIGGRRQLFTKSKSDLTSQQTVAGLSFNVTADGWIQVGYDSEKTTRLDRDSRAARRLIAESPALAQLLERSEHIIFQHAGKWYELPAKVRN